MSSTPGKASSTRTNTRLGLCLATLVLLPLQLRRKTLLGNSSSVKSKPKRSQDHCTENGRYWHGGCQGRYRAPRGGRGVSPIRFTSVPPFRTTPRGVRCFHWHSFRPNASIVPYPSAGGLFPSPG